MQPAPLPQEASAPSTESGQALSHWSGFRRVLAFGVATAGGAGFSPLAPGTVGSAVALLVFLGLSRLHLGLQLFAILGAIAAGLWAARFVQRYSGIADDRRIVIDEVAGMWIAVWGLPPTWFVLLGGFLLFRVLDIVKVFPACWFDRKWKNAWGVMMDDVVSGIYAAVLMRAALRIWGLT